MSKKKTNDPGIILIAGLGIVFAAAAQGSYLKYKASFIPSSPETIEIIDQTPRKEKDDFKITLSDGRDVNMHVGYPKKKDAFQW